MPKPYKKNDRWYFDVSIHDKRPRFCLGKVSKKSADSIAAHILAVVEAKRAGDTVSRPTAEWLDQCDDRLRKQLEKLGLVKPQQKRKGVTLSDLCDQYLSSSTSKDSTKESYRQTFQKLKGHFGSNVMVSEIDTQGVDLWIAKLHKGGSARATIGKHIKNAKSLFVCAVSWGYVTKSPLGHVKKVSQINPSRRRDVDPEIIDQILLADRDPNFCAVIGLARYAGLRVPSEAKELTWKDVDFDRKLLHVISPKQSSRPECQVRKVPLCGKVMKLLGRLPRGGPDELVFPKLMTAQALGRRLKLRCKELGIPMWPKALQNLRCSYANWLVRLCGGDIGSRIMGHTTRVAHDFYIGEQESDYHKVSEAQDLANFAFDVVLIGGDAESDAEATQNATHHTAAPAYTGSQSELQLLDSLSSTLVGATGCASVLDPGMGDGGLEPSTSRV